MRIGQIKKTIGLLDDVINSSRPWTARKIKGIYDKNPKRYEQMAECGMFDLMEDIFTHIDENIYFSENFLKDIKRVHQGKPLVTEVPTGTKPENLRNFVEEGEVGFLK